jgi:NADH:quinone reductase (non-electrogenic)
MSHHTNQHRIVVLGGGYTGMMSAIRMANRTRGDGGQVTVVNPSARFTERLRMHQIATGQQLADVSIPDLLAGTGAEFVEGRATRIDPVAREVRVDTVDGERVLEYDTLVYAIGSATATTTVSGVDAHAYTLNNPSEAARLAARLAEIPGGTVAVAGGGLTGIEAATEIAESHPGVRVILLTRNAPGSMMSDRARGYLNRALERLGIEVRAGVEVTKVMPDAVELASGELVPVDACLWTTGFVARPLAAEAGYQVDQYGRIVVDSTLRSVSHPSTYAIGDAAAIRQAWGTIHGTCQSGIPSGAYAADAIARRLRGRKVKPFRFGYIHQPVSLGRRDAVIQFTRADDTPRRWFLRGRLAVLYKQFVTSSPPLTYRISKRLNVPAAALAARGGRANRLGGAQPASPGC